MEKINHELYNQMLNSSEAAQKSSNKSEEKGYIRLYNLRNQKEKKNLLKTEILNNNNNINNNNLISKASKKKTIQERDRYLQNLYKEGLNFIEKVESERQNKQNEIHTQMRAAQCNPAWTENNKFFLEKVMQIFRNAMKRDPSAQDRHLYEIDEENKIKEEQVVSEKSSFDKNELKKFLFDFGFALFDFSDLQLESHREKVAFDEDEEKQNKNENEKEIKNENENNENKNKNVNENNANKNKEIKNALSKKPNQKEKVDLKAEENKLVNLFVDSVFNACGAADKISSNDLFLYVIGVLSLYDYFIYSSYKKSNPPSTLKQQQKQTNNNNIKITNTHNKQKLPKTEEEIGLKNQIINEIKQEIAKQAQKHFRYASFDSENKLKITDENAKNLKKDFHMFYLNFMFKHNIKNNKETVKVEVENEFRQNATFKPKIDENSKKLYSDYRRKILVNDTQSRGSAYGTVANKPKEINEYIDGLILRKKKKEK